MDWVGPQLEFVTHPAGKNTAGMTIVNLVFLVGLIILARLVARREKPNVSIAA
jgi:MFS-type transporter involved in bile tolerance (Atg22 family)